MAMTNKLRAVIPLVFLFGCGDDDPEPLTEVQLDSFWEVVSPASQQMNEASLKAVEDKVGKMSDVYSLLIVRNGKIVHEQYHNGANKNTLLHSRSITKRITATLTGIAIDRGDIESDKVFITDVLPDIDAADGWDEVTIYHLLNMISGMDWNENSQLNEYEKNLADPLKYIFSKKIIHQPETNYSYNTPGIDLLPYAIERSSRQELAAYAQEHLFGPLGILGYEWEEIGDKVKRGGAGLELTARDLAKFGLLYLQKGQWKGEQVVSEQWVNRCFEDLIELDDLKGDHLPGIMIGQSWWARDIYGERVHYGDGYGGQVLLVVPRHNLVVVMNRFYRVEPGTNYAAFESFFSEVFPGILSSISD